MNLSYRDLEVRDYCYSKNPDLSNNRFTINEIVAIRAYIADLRAAPRLSDVPFNYNFIIEDGVQNKLVIQFDHIQIFCVVISAIDTPTPSQIKRIKILDILRIDLHLAHPKTYSA